MSFGVSAEAGSATPGRLMPLCSPSGAAADDDGLRRRAVRRLDAQLDAAVVEQQPVARADRLGEAGEGRRHAAGAAHEVAGGDLQRRAGHEVDGLAIDQLAGADLRPGQVLQDGDVPAGRAPRPRGCG